MAISRSEALDKIERQRNAIREHIEKYERYQGTGDTSALVTIQNCQNNIQDLKDRCTVSIEGSWEDDWAP